MVLNSINPEITNWWGFFLFYFSLFLAVSGTASVLGFIVRFIGLRREWEMYSVKSAFRQSFLFAGLVIISLALLAKDLFTWFNLLILILGLSVLEYFLLSYSETDTERGTQNTEQGT